MSERSKDWLNQAKRDLENAKYELKGGFFEFACFLSQQSAEKALKALYQKLGAEVFGHSVTGLMQRFPLNSSFTPELINIGKELDKAYIPTRYPDSHPEGSPFMMYSAGEAERLIAYAERIVDRCQDLLSKIDTRRDTAAA